LSREGGVVGNGVCDTEGDSTAYIFTEGETAVDHRVPLMVVETSNEVRLAEFGPP
jgi:hypothetical protein